VSLAKRYSSIPVFTATRHCYASGRNSTAHKISNSSPITMKLRS